MTHHHDQRPPLEPVTDIEAFTWPPPRVNHRHPSNQPTRHRRPLEPTQTTDPTEDHDTNAALNLVTAIVTIFAVIGFSMLFFAAAAL